MLRRVGLGVVLPLLDQVCVQALLGGGCPLLPPTIICSELGLSFKPIIASWPSPANTRCSLDR
jgi:hypothetical protein